MGRGKTILAFFLAPLATAFFIFFASLILGKASEGIWAFGLFLAAAYPIMLVLGIPIHLALSKLKIRSFIVYIICGVVVAVAFCFAIFSNSIMQSLSLNIPLNKALDSALYASLIAATLGGITAFTFWGVARPDRT